MRFHLHFEMVLPSSLMESTSTHDGTIILPNTPVPREIDLEVATEPAHAVCTNQSLFFFLKLMIQNPTMRYCNHSSHLHLVTDTFVHSSEAPREIIISISGRQRFVLVLEDRQIITCVLNYLRSISDSFDRSQTNSILCSCLRLIVRIPEACEYLEEVVHEGSVKFASLLDMIFQIHSERTAERSELYLRTVLDTITDWLHPDHPY